MLLLSIKMATFLSTFNALYWQSWGKILLLILLIILLNNVYWYRLFRGNLEIFQEVCISFELIILHPEINPNEMTWNIYQNVNHMVVYIIKNWGEKLNVKWQEHEQINYGTYRQWNSTNPLKDSRGKNQWHWKISLILLNDKTIWWYVIKHMKATVVDFSYRISSFLFLFVFSTMNFKVFVFFLLMCKDWPKQEKEHLTFSLPLLWVV